MRFSDHADKLAEGGDYLSTKPKNIPKSSFFESFWDYLDE